MPSDWLYMDTKFPTFTGEETTEEKVSAMQNYLFMLLEQLRYSLRNLDLSNMNSAAVESFRKTITDPIYAEIQDADGNLTNLQVTVQGLQTTVQSQAGDISTLQQTAQSIQSTVTNQAGDISTLQQTAQSIQSTVQSLNGDITSVAQTANKIDWLVASGTSAANFTLTSRMASLVAAEIDLTGYVTISSMEGNSQTKINGALIETGKIVADDVTAEGRFKITHNDTQVGWVGYSFGNDGQSTTYGPMLAKDYTHYLIVTGSGVRMQSTLSKIYVSDSEARLQPNGKLYLGGATTTKLILPSSAYGSSLPSGGETGQIFFKI